MRENRALLLTLSIIFICTITGYVLYTLFGHPLIRAMYEGRSIEILNRMIEGQAISPVERYYETGDSLFTRFLIFIFCVFISLIIVVKPLISRIYLAVLNTIDFWLQHKIILLLLGTFISITVLVYIAIFILQDFPNSSDEYNYLQQAKMLLNGKFWNKPHPLQEFFKFTNIIEKDGKLVNISPPGWPLALTLAMLLKIPLWLVNPIFGTLSLLVVFFLGKRLYGERVALLSTVTIFISSFFLFNSASYFTHTLASLLILLFIYFGLLFTDEEAPKYALLTGIFFGAAFLTRYYTTLACALLLGIYLFSKKPQLYKKIKWFLVGASPFIIFLLIYNYKITGNPSLVPGFESYRKLWFYPGFLTSGPKSLLLQLGKLMRWSPPFLLLINLVYLRYSFRKPTKGYIELIFWSLVFASIFFIPSSYGNEYGPRYYYEGFPFLVLFTIANLFKEDSYYKKNGLSKFLLWLFILSLILNIPMLIDHLRIEREVVWGRKDLYRLVEKEKIKNAIIFLKTGSGASRQMPIRDLTRNDIDYSNSVLYVWDRGEENRKLMEYYPKRNHYIYFYDKNSRRGFVSDVLTLDKKLYSQGNEEPIIRDFFNDRRGGVFVDVGCAHYKEGSTTYYLEKHLGWSGIGVDALTEWAPGYTENRPKTMFFNYIVTDHSGDTEPFYRVSIDPFFSSTDKKFAEYAAEYVAKKKIKQKYQVIYVPPITLNELLEKNGIFKIDLLSMDIEKGEPSALAGFDIKRFKPELVCIETNKPDIANEILNYFTHHGYERIEKYRAYDNQNWYFKPKD